MEQRRIQLNILPVLEGDCIHLRFRSADGWHNIIVDSGPEAAADTFLTLLQAIWKRGEKVDLLCFTHIHDDHIKGAMTAMNNPEFRPGEFGQIWMNMPKNETGVSEPENEVRVRGLERGTPRSFAAAENLTKSISGFRLPYCGQILAGHSIRIGDALISAVLPIPKRMVPYYHKMDDYCNKRDINIRKPSRDKSVTNGSSIGLLCQIGEQRILLAGDAFPNDLAAIGKKYAGDQGFSLVKLPHHGSDANTTPAMLEALKSRNFIISTVQNEKRPGEQAMEMLSNYGKSVGDITVYGNYPWNRFAQGVANVKIVVPEGAAVTEDGIEVYADGKSQLIFAE